MPLHAYLGWPGPVTHRQHAAFCAWLDEQMNVPDRSDYYAMATAAAVRDVARMFSKTARATRLQDCQITFTRRREKPLTEDERRRRLEVSKAAWLGAVGLNRKRKDVAPKQPPKGDKP